MYIQPIRHNSYSILAVQRSSRERVYTSPGSGDEAPPYCQYMQLLCQFFIFLKQLIYLLYIIIRLHWQSSFVNWSDNLLFFFQIIRYLCHCFIFLDFLDDQWNLFFFPSFYNVPITVDTRISVVPVLRTPTQDVPLFLITVPMWTLFLGHSLLDVIF